MRRPFLNKGLTSFWVFQTLPWRFESPAVPPSGQERSAKIDERRGSSLRESACSELEGGLSSPRFARASAASGSAADDTGVALREREGEEPRSGGATAGGGLRVVTLG